MLRQCFFPASTTYRRRSRNQIKPSTEREVSVTGYFVKRLNLSCRRPKPTENTNSLKEKQNFTFSEDQTLQLTKNSSFTVKSNASRKPQQSEQLILRKRRNDISDKKQLALQEIKVRRKPDSRLMSSKGRKTGVLQIKNEEWNWNAKHHWINMTERMKPKPLKDFDHIIAGWQCHEQTDNCF